MALVVNTNIGGRKYIDMQGLKIVVADITFQTSDYSTGIDLESIKSQIGLDAVVCVLDASLRSSANALKPLAWNYRAGTATLAGKLQFLRGGAVNDVLEDAATATSELANGDIARVVILGY